MMDELNQTMELVGLNIIFEKTKYMTNLLLTDVLRIDGNEVH